MFVFEFNFFFQVPMLVGPTSSSSSSSANIAQNVPLRRADLETGTELTSVSSSKPQLIYCVVAKEKAILAEFACCVGNFATITRILLEKITPTTGQRKSYTYDSYVFHYITSAGLTYICLADRGMGQTVPLRFLDEICGRFEASPMLAASRTAVALQMNAEFQPIIRGLMEKYNEAADSSMERIRAHVAEITDNMIENIDKIMERQEKIELLVEKTETLNRTAIQFRRQAVDVRRTLWWRDVRAKIIMVSIALTLIFLLITWLCGGFSYDKCRKD
jgi:vesicle-associated membrane protein 7